MVCSAARWPRGRLPLPQRLLVRLAVSLGGVESLACHPLTTTASEMSEEDLRASGLTEGLVRLSIGVEYWRTWRDPAPPSLRRAASVTPATSLARGVAPSRCSLRRARTRKALRMRMAPTRSPPSTRSPTPKPAARTTPGCPAPTRGSSRCA
jgi:hypothetical protein